MFVADASQGAVFAIENFGEKNEVVLKMADTDIGHIDGMDFGKKALSSNNNFKARQKTSGACWIFQEMLCDLLSFTYISHRKLTHTMACII